MVREGDEETVGGETAQRILIVDDAPLNRAILREMLGDIPVIMITADTSADSMSHAYELGVADYIERPFDVQVVRRRVMNTVKLYARQRRLRGFTG